MGSVLLFKKWNLRRFSINRCHTHPNPRSLRNPRNLHNLHNHHNLHSLHSHHSHRNNTDYLLGKKINSCDTMSTQSRAQKYRSIRHLTSPRGDDVYEVRPEQRPTRPSEHTSSAIYNNLKFIKAIILGCDFKKFTHIKLTAIELRLLSAVLCLLGGCLLRNDGN